MHLNLLAVGNRMPSWVETAYADYAKRMPSDYKLSLKEIRPEARSTGKTAMQIKSLEAARISAALPSACLLVVLDEHGKEVTTMQLAELLKQWQGNYREVAFVIGGADGLDSSLIARSDFCLRLSSMTLPHAMVRVLLAEQLYRAWSVLHNHPYHRA